MPVPRGPFLRKRRSISYRKDKNKDKPNPNHTKLVEPRQPKSSISILKPSNAEIREVIELSKPAAPELVLPEPIIVPPHKRVKSDMDFFSGQSDKFEKYGGVRLIGNLYYIYLLNKYKSKCIAYDFGQFGLALHVSKNYSAQERLEHYRHMQYVANQISKCIRAGLDTVIIPVSIKLGNHAGHANALIYRKIDNTIERFEPHGSMFGKGLDTEIEGKLVEFCAMINTEFDKYGGLPHIRFRSASEVCPRINGLQNLESIRKSGPEEGGGYCIAWSMFFVELALSNPGVPSNELLEMVMQHIKRGKTGQTYLVKIIKGYAYHISTKLEKYFSILFGETNIYNKIVEKTIKRRAVIRKIEYLVKIEMKSNMDPQFNMETEMQKIRDSLDVIGDSSDPTSAINTFRAKELREELDVYEKIAGLKNPSPMREYEYELPKKKSRKNAR